MTRKKTKSIRSNHKRVIIIGAGSAGLSAQSWVSRWTDDYLVVDHGPLGTTCARVGCMPSKAFVEAAHIFAGRSKMRKIGVEGTEKLSLRSDVFFEHVRGLQSHFASGMVEETKRIPAGNLLMGKAVFTDPKTIRVGEEEFTADHFIVGTGSASILPSDWESFRGQVLLSDDVFQLRSVPKSLAVIGAGTIGLELALAFAELGVQVSVYGAGPNMGGLTDPVVLDEAKKLISQRVELRSDRVSSLAGGKGRWRIQSGTGVSSFEEVLVAVGRSPRLELFEKLRLKRDQKGIPIFDPKSHRILGTQIYLVGDAAGAHPIWHEAIFEGKNAAMKAVPQKGKKSVLKRPVPMRLIFSTPQIAMVGQGFKALKQAKVPLLIGEADLARQGRSLTRLENEGRLRLYFHKKSKGFLGAEIVSHEAEHLAHFLALALEMKATVHDLFAVPYYHPTVEESLKTALRSLSAKG